MKNTFSLLEMKKEAMKKWPVLNDNVFFEGLYKSIKTLFDNYGDKYFLLLNREKCDITMFICPISIVELEECIMNRGKPLDVGLTENKDAVEIWIKTPENEVCVYYFFPYDNGVIKND